MLKKKKLILGLILLLGFILRLYGATVVPPSYDENLEFPYAKEISFNLKNPNLPLVIENNPATVGHLYLVKAGLYLFGENILGARIPFVIMGVLTILLVYFFVQPVLGIKTGLLAAFLLSLSQFHIALTRAFHAEAGVIFFTLFSLLLFYEIIKNPNKYLILLNGLVIGIGYLVKENIIFLVPIYIIFLITSSEYRKLLKEKYIWFSFVLTLLIALPNLYLALSLNTSRVSHVLGIAHLKPSINALGIYLGEIILYAFRPFPELFRRVAFTTNEELPAETFVLGIIILAGVIYSVKDKKPFIRLLIICFLFNFIVFSFIRSISYATFIDTFWSLGDLNWSCIAFVPGVILAAKMLSDLINKRNYGKLFFSALAIFMLIRAVDFVTFPVNAQVPIRYFHIETRSLPRAKIFMEKGNYKSGRKILSGVYKAAGTKLELKQRAAFKLDLLSKRKDIKEKRH